MSGFSPAPFGVAPAILGNNVFLQGKDTGAVVGNLIGVSSGDVVQVGMPTHSLFVQGFGLPGKLLRTFVSAAQVMTAGGTITLAHGLGIVPLQVHCLVQCVTAEGNWSVGDQILASQESFNNGSGFTVYSDATNIKILIGSNGRIQIWDKTTGGIFVMTLANWKFVIKAST